jgi:hypothetical protein
MTIVTFAGDWGRFRLGPLAQIPSSHRGCSWRERVTALGTVSRRRAHSRSRMARRSGRNEAARAGGVRRRDRRRVRRLAAVGLRLRPGGSRSLGWLTLGHAALLAIRLRHAASRWRAAGSTSCCRRPTPVAQVPRLTVIGPRRRPGGDGPPIFAMRRSDNAEIALPGG